MQTTVLSLKNIHKSFGTKKVHQGINLDLQEGEIIGLLGGSGTGKSVLIRSVIGLEKPDQGSILFENKDITQLNEYQLTPVRTKIGYVFQNGALFDSLTVEQNLSYPLKEHTQLSEEEIKLRVNEMLKLINMEGSNQLLPNELSGGMQKRVGLARATILKPSIILFDEPTAGLDPANTKRLIENIKTLKKLKLSGIFVTHDIPAVLEIADRIAILYEGKIYVVDTVENLKRSNDPVIISFLGEHHHAQ